MPIISEIVSCKTGARFAGEATKQQIDAAEDLRAVKRIAERYQVNLGSSALAAYDVVQPARLGKFLPSYAIPRALRLGVEWTKGRRNGDSALFSMPTRDNRYGLKFGGADDYRDEVIMFRVTENDPLGCASRAPMTTAGELRQIATDFCLAIMPVAALDAKAIEVKSSEGRRAITRMIAAAGMYFDVYALAPLRLYSLEQHVRSTAPLTLFSPAAEQVAMSLVLNVPMFRSVMGDLNELDDRVSGLERKTDAIRARVADVERQMASMRMLVERAERKAAEAVIKAAQLAKQIEAAAFLAQDPLLFAVQRGVDVTSFDGPAILGPCWGADIDLAIVRKLGYKPLTTRAKYDRALPW